MKLFETKISTIIIHCDASDTEDSVEAIRKLHTQDATTLTSWNDKLILCKGWDEIAYHHIITQNGEQHLGRDMKYQGAHCLGQNHDSIAICLTGDKHFSLAQFRTLLELIEVLKHKYRLKDSDIKGHYMYSSKPCPNFRVNL